MTAAVGNQYRGEESFRQRPDCEKPGRQRRLMQQRVSLGVGNKEWVGEPALQRAGPRRSVGRSQGAMVWMASWLPGRVALQESQASEQHP